MPGEPQLIAQMAKSKYWRWMRGYLLARRDVLFAEVLNTPDQLWKNRGAIEEVQRLLKAPELILAWYQAQEKEADEKPPEWVPAISEDFDA